MSSNLKCTDDLDDSTICDGVFSGTITTTDNTPTLLASFTVPQDHGISALCRVAIRRTDGGGAGDGAFYTINCGFKDVSGTVTQIGTTSVVVAPVLQSSLGVTVGLSASINGSSIEIFATGETSKTYIFRAVGQYFYVG